MAKIGTAHIELKPVIDEVALSVITERIAEAVAEGVRRGMKSAPTTIANDEYERFMEEMRRRADREPPRPSV